MMFFKTISTRIAILTLLLCVGGCDYALFDPKGPTAEAIHYTMTYTVLLMLIVIIPTLILCVYIPYRFNAKNKNKNTYKPNWSHSTAVEIIVWTIPIIIVTFLAIETFKTSHALDPRQAIKSDKEPLKIQVVSLDWKWLFIYPEDGVASVNELSIPVNQPIEFLITSDSSINSFFIPRLGSQIYAMTGMENRLNLMASEAGVFKGFSANYSGFGFSGMRFNTHATDEATHKQWIEKVRTQGKPLNDENYEKLVQKTRDHPIEYFINSDPLRFKNIIKKYSGLLNKKPVSAHGHDSHGHDGHSHDTQNKDTHGEKKHDESENNKKSHD